MCSALRPTLLAVLIAGTCAAGTQPLRVCADPNNLPYSNSAGEGFENKVAQLVGNRLGRTVEYVWWPQQRPSFLRYTLLANRCDVVMGVGPGAARIQTTRPYYRSSFVFVARRGQQPAFHSMDDIRLRRMRIGVHVVGQDYSSVPPVKALADRGITGNIVGYSIYGDYSRQNPRAPLIDAVAHGDVDVAIVWGPLAGYFARTENTPLQITGIAPDARDRLLPFSFDIAMGVRPADFALKDQLNGVIAKNGPEIQKILAGYGVPRTEIP